jgi:hypothetical protein
MAGVTRKAIEDLRRAYGIGDIGGCPVCRDVYIAGMPGLWAVAYRGPLVRTADGMKRGLSVMLSHEEARSFFYGCPECGEDVKTYPIVIQGLRPVEIPDPWPISEWPEPDGPPGKRGNVYDEEAEA